MEIVIKGLASGYEPENLARIFYPGALPRTGGSTCGDVVYGRYSPRRMVAGLRQGGKLKLLAETPSEAEPPKLALSRLLYRLLREATGLRPPWGMLTGVRPVRLCRVAMEEGGEAAAEAKLRGVYDVSEGKYDLVRRVVQTQRPLVQAASGARDYSLYVSIPFCPSRCNYCSFVSRTIGQEGHLVPAYLEKLQEELAATAELAQQCGLQLKSIYVGGGTPTALSAGQLRGLLQSIARYFDTKTVAEYTVEAGRPDCTDAEKLAVLKEFGVGRISINPQSFNDKALRAIGRAHSADDVRRCFAGARAAGHDSINMDLIAGLPGDTPEGFAASLAEAVRLAPENITVHTLTLKRASNFVIDHKTEASAPGRMIEAAYPVLEAAGYGPYYLYRQKSTVENLENTGWAKPGCEGLYNIAIMEEIHSILAVGAGASTKMVGQGGRQIERLYNFKLPNEYIRQFDVLLHKKQGVRDFYARYLDP